MKKTYKMPKVSIIVILFSISILLSSCQPNPITDAVVNKTVTGKFEVEERHSTDIESENAKKNTIIKDDENSSATNKIKAELIYGNNEVLIDAIINKPETQKTPVLRVVKKDFDDLDMEKIIYSAVPNALIYGDGGTLSPSEIEEEIIRTKKTIAEAEKNTTVVEEDGSIKTYNLDFLYSELKRLENAYADALENYVEDLPPIYSFNQVDKGDYQAGFICKSPNGDIYDVTFQNSDTGNLFWLDSKYSIIDNAKKFYTYNEVINQNNILANQKNIADEFVKKIGLAEYMTLNVACYGTVVVDANTKYKDVAQCYYYTPTYNDLQLSYIASHIGTSAMNVDGNDIYMPVIRPEYMRIVVYEGKILEIFWENPIEILNIDNENVNALPWDKIEELFYTQIQRVFSEQGMYKNSIITINRADFGLTKVLVNGEQSIYQLVPTWSFFGTIENKNMENHDVLEKCIVTVNAIDGSIIDRGLMY